MNRSATGAWAGFVLAAGMLAPPFSGRTEEAPAAPPMEPVRLSADGKGFVVGEPGRTFRVWGVNYDHDATEPSGRLIEDYWAEEWETVRQDFQEIRDLGANTVRIHLQLGRFMAAPGRVEEGALAQLRRLLALAEETGLYLDLTGLGCYHRADIPPWYDSLAEGERWEVQARFWQAVAQTCRDSPAVFCYDLMNEPILGGGKPGEWLTGELGGKWFVQRIALDLAGRSQTQVARDWVAKLSAAIRAEDPEHLITVGEIPWAMVWPGAKPIFYAPEVSPMLDFVSIHVYPKAGEVDKALAALAVFDTGKPLVIEETFPLECSLAEMESFLERSRERAEGWMSFYWGRTIQEYEREQARSSVNALMVKWLGRFRERSGIMSSPAVSPP